MGQFASARSLSVASAIEKAEVVPEERAAECERPSLADEKSARHGVSLETVLAVSKFAPPEGNQNEIRAHLEAEMEAGATLYDFREDGTYVARTKSGEREISPSAADGS